jgi:hypothetical protein
MPLADIVNSWLTPPLHAQVSTLGPAKSNTSRQLPLYLFTIVPSRTHNARISVHSTYRGCHMISPYAHVRMRALKGLACRAYHVHAKHAPFVFQFHCWFLPSHVPPPLSLGYTLTKQATTNKVENKNSMPDEAESFPPLQRTTNAIRAGAVTSVGRRARQASLPERQARPMSACILSSKRVFSTCAHERKHTLKALVVARVTLAPHASSFRARFCSMP